MNYPTVGFIIDSRTAIPEEVANRHGLRIVRNYVNFGATESYQDGTEITVDALLRRPDNMESAKTSQPSTGDWINAFEEMGKRYDHVIVPLGSGKLGGAYSGAVLAARMVPQYEIDVLDTKSSFMGPGLMALRSALAIAQGARFDEAIEVIQGLIPRMNVIFLPDTLDRLRRGGRLAASENNEDDSTGSPIIETRDGVQVLVERTTTRDHAKARMCEIIRERASGRPVHISIGYGNDSADTRDFLERLRTTIQFADVLETQLTPMTIVHTGPGILAVAFYTE